MQKYTATEAVLEIITLQYLNKVEIIWKYYFSNNSVNTVDQDIHK